MAINSLVLPFPPSVQGSSPADRTDSVCIMYVDSAMDEGSQPVPRVAAVEVLLLFDTAPNGGIVLGLNRAANTTSCA